MSAEARRKNRAAGEKLGKNREAGRTPRSEVRTLREDVDPWDVSEQPWEIVLSDTDLD